MPIYVHHCNSFGRRSQLFLRRVSAVGEASCPGCQSSDVGRVPSRVAVVRSESSYQDFLADPTNFEGIDYEDPKAVAQWAKKIGQAAGADVGGDYEEMVESMGSGESAGDIADDFGG